MSDIWKVQEEQSRKEQFVQTRMETEEVSGIDKNGNPYSHDKITVFLVPIEPEKQIKEYNTRDFVLDWQKITIPSVQKLLADEKIKAFSEMQKEQFCTILWEEYRDRDDYRIAKKKKDGYEQHVHADEKGEYILYLGVNFTNVFVTEKEWRQTHESNAATKTQPELPTEQKADPVLEAAKAAIPTLVQQCGTDLKALQDKLSHPPFNQFSLQDKFVKLAVAKLIAVQAGADAAKQEEMLKEINSHFNGDTPYLTADSPELTSQLEEVAF